MSLEFHTRDSLVLPHCAYKRDALVDRLADPSQVQWTGTELADSVGEFASPGGR